MCGRYVISLSEAEMQDLFDRIARRDPQAPVHAGEIFPTDTAPVLIQGANGLGVRPCVWGFPAPASGGVIINARAESVEERAMFRGAFFRARCIVPCSGFYEWTHGAAPKQKFLFRESGRPSMYLAGLRAAFSGREHFVILTTQANDSMAPVHSRMPVFLAREERRAWLEDLDFARLKLTAPLPALERIPVSNSGV